MRAQGLHRRIRLVGHDSNRVFLLQNSQRPLDSRIGSRFDLAVGGIISLKGFQHRRRVAAFRNGLGNEVCRPVAHKTPDLLQRPGRVAEGSQSGVGAVRQVL